MILQRARQETLNEGDPNCTHERICYVDSRFSGQSWVCDYGNCRRTEGIEPRPQQALNPPILRFPPGALIRTPHVPSGWDTYTMKADENGIPRNLPDNEILNKTYEELEDRI